MCIRDRDEVIESKESRIFEQAENRMHAQQALLSCLCLLYTSDAADEGLGVEVRIACPKGYEPNALVINRAEKIYKNKNLLKITNDPFAAVQGANVLYTDVWSSMGEENQKEEKDKDFLGFTIDKNLVRNADKDAIILHCLPAYRDKEITEEMIDCENSRIFDQAENRMHAQQALLSCLLL